MIVSHPSKPVHVFDSPEVVSVRPKFIYNFFTPNESIDESGFSDIDGALPDRFKRRSSPDFSNINARVPRFVKIDLSFSDTASMTDMNISKSSILTATKKELTEWLSSGKLVTETNATSDVYSAFTIGNSLIAEELHNLMIMKLNRYIESGDSPQSALTKLCATTSVDPDTLSLMIPPELNNSPVGSLTQAGFAEQTQGLDRIQSGIQLNSSFAPMMLRRSVERGTSLLDSTVNANFTLATSRLKNSTNVIGEISPVRANELEFNIPHLSIIPQPADVLTQVTPAKAAVVGLLIEKTRVFKGKKYPMPPVIVAGSRPDVIYDSKVAYGQTYEYTARTLSLFLVSVTTADGDRYRYKFLVASKPSQPVQLDATENIKPDPPSDVRYSYEYNTGGLSIFWSPPTNPQRDVKYYQVFRRKTTSEPFELLAHLDFDDSIIRTDPAEYVDPGLVITSPRPIYSFVDHEFSKESGAIYAVVSIDARQLSSGYSTQTRVVFNSSKNRIDRKLVCFKDAPKQYPNWTLQENFFIDSMKDSAHTNVSIYFDPEAYTLIDKNGESIPVFSTNTSDALSKYVFQFINTDRLLEQKFEIKIDDLIYSEQNKSSRGKSTKPSGPKKAAIRAKKLKELEARSKARHKKSKRRRGKQRR